MTELVTADAVRRVAVLGAGTMGHGIAQVAAQAGFSVHMRDLDRTILDGALARVRANLDKGVKLGKVEADAAAAALERIETTTSVADAVTDADVVIEAAPERLAVKEEIFRELATAVPARALLATNTSSLPVAVIAAAAPAASRVVGLHFFNPVHIMKLVEIVHHAGTDPAALACAQELVQRLGKTGITVADAPGFASSRLGLALGLEAIRMVEQGVASVGDIDTAMKLGYGHPMGPLELTDLVGLDVRLHIADYLAGELGEHFRPPALLRRMVADGRLGKKSGEGFYRWRDGKRVD
jgi:3-hydroxybutyryl-CoA dehydrogenase